MAWVRLHDGAMTHPKIVGLSDKAFRLWVWGLSYAQQHLTDGWLPTIALPAVFIKAVSDLLTAELWQASEGGYRIHDYLDWNDGKAVVTQKRQQAKERMASARERSSSVRANVLENIPRTSIEVLRGVGRSSSSGKENQDRAASLLNDLYPAWYAKWRNGARLRLIANSLAYQDALSLVALWDDARLEQLAQVFLTTDDDWIAHTDRGFRVFVSKISWCDDRLKQAELQVAK